MRREPELPQTGQPTANSCFLPNDIVVIPKRGLRFPRQLAFDSWLSVGRQLSDIYTSSAWCLGDWLVYGETAYRDRYHEAVEQTALDYQTLRNYAWVVKRFPLTRRRGNLSFGHHAEVASLPEAEQNFWLRKAEEFGWSVKRLRLEVRTSLAQRSARCPAGEGLSGDGAPRDGPRGTTSETQPNYQDQGQRATVTLIIQLTPEQWHAYQTVAERVGLTVQQWASKLLSETAVVSCPPSPRRLPSLQDGS